jgi:hypothetical protein
MEKLEIYSSLLSLLLLAREQISIRRDDLIPMVEELLYYAKVFKGIGCCWWVTAYMNHPWLVNKNKGRLGKIDCLQKKSYAKAQIFFYEILFNNLALAMQEFFS